MTLPAPLVTPEVNLGCYDWYKIYPERVRKSRWWRRASHLARSVNFTLWGEAWKAVPAGSLPDDDDELAEAAGFGFDTAAFQAVKAEIMEPWLLCSDGRWYHPTVCEQVLEVWDTLGERRKQGALRQARHKAKVRQTKGEDLEQDAPLREIEDDAVTRYLPEVTRQHACDNASSASRERRGEEKDTVASASPATGSKAWDQDKGFSQLWALAPTSMKRRSSQKLTWPEYRNATRQLPPDKLISAFRAYQASDEDFKRTGGPGLHIWLKANRWEAWIETTVAPMDRGDDFWRAAVRMFQEQGRWSDDLGPPPGQPGTKVPARISIGAVA